MIPLELLHRFPFSPLYWVDEGCRQSHHGTIANDARPTRRRNGGSAQKAGPVKTLVLGLGNPILGDDGVGWKVAEEVRKLLASPPAPLPVGEGCRRRGEGVDVDCLSLGGLSLMEHLIGYQRAVLIDAFALDEPIGSILILKLSDLPNYSAFHTTSAHDTSLQNAIKLGRSMGALLPEDITVIGIATRQVYDFSEELSPPVAQAVPQATQIVLDLLEQKVTAQ